MNILTDSDPRTYAIIGAAMEVHQHLGPGFLEAIYERALCHELTLRGIPFDPQHYVDVHYKGLCVGQGHLDLLVDDRLIVELKAVRTVPSQDVARVISYLKATGLELALILNFDAPMLKDGIQRLIGPRRDLPSIASARVEGSTTSP